MKNYARFRQFIGDFTRLIEPAPAEPVILDRGGKILATLNCLATISKIKKATADKRRLTPMKIKKPVEQDLQDS